MKICALKEKELIKIIRELKNSITQLNAIKVIAKTYLLYTTKYIIQYEISLLKIPVIIKTKSEVLTMNCFNFESKQAYMDYVRTLSDEEIVHQRKLMSNLLDDIKYKCENAKLNIEAIIIPSLKALIKKRNISESNEKFKQLLKEFFNTISIDKDYLEDSNNFV